MEPQITVWRVALDEHPPPTGLDWLSPTERERASRFSRPADAAAFVTLRILLRREIGRLTGCSPELVQLEISRTGKPRLAFPARPTLEFSITHTRGLGLLAIGEGGRVGVDAEALATPHATVEAIQEVLGPDERRHAEGLTGEARHRWLLETWVAREALVKALGLGLGLGEADLQGLQRPDTPGRGPWRYPVPPALECPGGWWLHRVDAGAVHTAALVTEGGDQPVRQSEGGW